VKRHCASRLGVRGCPATEAVLTAGVPQIADAMLHGASRQDRAMSRLMRRNMISEPNTKGPSGGGLSEHPFAFLVRRPAESGT
jgi:hypothetical protein